MKIITVELEEVNDNEDGIGFVLCYEDNAGKRGGIRFTPDIVHEELFHDVMRADSQLNVSREAILSVLHAFGENLELGDK